MSDCINILRHNSSDVLFNECNQSYAVWIQQDKIFTKERLIQIATDCFELSKERLIEESEQDIVFGKSIFEDLTEKITNLAIEFEPLMSFGFSVSLEPSLHYIVRFQKDITLFFETYIDFANGLETYVQIYDGKDLVLSISDTISNALFYVENALQEKLANRTYHL